MNTNKLSTNVQKMKIKKLYPVGIEITNFDLASASDGDLKKVPRLLSEHRIVVIRNQAHLSLSEFDRANRFWGRHEKSKLWCRHPESDLVMRVTNKEVVEGRQGLFPVGEMQWHTNGPLMPAPEEALALWCIQAGDGGTTSFLDCVSAYESLSDRLRQEIQNKKILLTNKSKKTLLKKTVCVMTDKEALAELEVHRTRRNSSIDRDAVSLSCLGHESATVAIEKNILVEHPVSKKVGIYLPFFYIEKIVDSESNPCDDSLFYQLYDHMLEADKFVYHHDWSAGDVLLSDQLLTQHKRSDYKGERELFRTVFWYEK